MTQTTETRPGGAGSEDTCLLGSERLPDNTPPKKFQAPSSGRAETGGEP
jgi:hypothetical protein